MEAGKVNPSGPLVFVFDGVTGQPDEPFDLTLAQTVADKDAKLEGYTNQPLPAFHCVSFYFTGRYADLPKAYGRVMREVNEGGYVMTGVNREVCLYHESDDSANNITEIQIEVRADGVGKDI